MHSREQLRNDAALEISISPLTSLAARTTDQRVISRVADRANYTATYKEAMAAQADVGSRMSMVSEKELQLREKEVAVREIDVAARENKDNLESFTSIYDDLRKDLRESKEYSAME